MLTKAFILVLVMLIGLALGFETARMVHSQPSTTGMVNIHLVVFAGVLLAVLWVSRAWLARQWTCFTVWLELTFDGLFDFDALNVGDGTGPVVLRGDDAKQLLTPKRLTRAERTSAQRASCSMLSRDPDINGGDLCITGTRIPIWILWDARSGSNFQEYIDNLRMDYPNLSSEQIKAALQYAFSHPSEIDKDRFRHEVEECEGSETERQLAHPSGTK